MARFDFRKKMVHQPFFYALGLAHTSHFQAIALLWGPFKKCHKPCNIDLP